MLEVCKQCQLTDLFFLQVADVKKNIEATQGQGVYPAEQQMLIHQGKILKDDTTLQDNKVAENSFIVIMLTKVWLFSPWFNEYLVPIFLLPYVHVNTIKMLPLLFYFIIDIPLIFCLSANLMYFVTYVKLYYC